MTERRRNRPPTPSEADLNEPISLWPMEAEEVLRKLLETDNEASSSEDTEE